MKNLAILSFLMLCACTTTPVSNTVTIISYEKDTNIYKNDELIGRDATQTELYDKGIQNVIFKGVKKGCVPAVVRAEYEFDTDVLYPYYPENWVRWINGNWYKKTEKRTYYLTPICN